MRRELSLAVVGADHPNPRGPTRRFEIAITKPGDPVSLVREPKNPADPRAVAVFSERGVKLGYLTAERAPWIGGMMTNGREITAVFQRASSYGAVIRIAFDGETPTLPEAESHVSREPDPSGFVPDDIWPDD